MRVYIAALWNTLGVTSNTPNNIPLYYMDIPYVLESYYYLRKQLPVIEHLKSSGRTIFLDSGAYSMFTQKILLDVREYGDFILEHPKAFHVASNLDDVTKTEQITWDNQMILEKMGCKIQPVFHTREDPKWLQRYLDAGYDYIFIGGMVAHTTSWLRDWLDNIWHNYLIDKDGMPKVKVHGFGLTTPELMQRYPWYSVDSSSWVMMSSFGSSMIDLKRDDGTLRPQPIVFSDKSPARNEVNSWHYQSLPQELQHKICERLEELDAERKAKNPLPPQIEQELFESNGIRPGYNVEALSKMYGWRRHLNIHYYAQFNEKPTTPFIRQQELLFDA